jgi:hypothetical protein
MQHPDPAHGLPALMQQTSFAHISPPPGQQSFCVVHGPSLPKQQSPPEPQKASLRPDGQHALLELQDNPTWVQHMLIPSPTGPQYPLQHASSEQTS